MMMHGALLLLAAAAHIAASYLTNCVFHSPIYFCNLKTFNINRFWSFFSSGYCKSRQNLDANIPIIFPNMPPYAPAIIE
jgi:hypothetical protein